MFGLGFNKAWSQERNYLTFNEEDGLPSSTIYSIFQDSKGYIWFATDQGVSRYDGYQFNNYTISDGLSDSEVFNFFEDSSTRIWFYTLNGKVSYYLDGSFYNSQNDSTLLGLDSNSMITSVFEDNSKNIWMTVYNYGLLKYSHDEIIERYFQDDSLGHISGAFLQNNDSVYLIAGSGIFPTVPNLKKITENKKKFLPPGSADLYNSKFIRISEEKVWITNKERVYECSYKEDTLSVIFHKSEKIHVNNICKFDDEVWICTSHGTYEYSIQRKKILKNILMEQNISSVLKDSEGNYWFGTLGNGLLFHSVNRIYTVKEKGVYNQKITTLINGIDSSLWFIKSNKIECLNSNLNVKTLNFNDKMLEKGNGVNRIRFDKKNIWLATNILLIRIAEFSQSSLFISTKDIFFDDSDRLWIASAKGLYILPKEEFNNLKNRIGIVDQMEIYRVLKQRTNKIFKESRNNIYIATESEVYIKGNDERGLKLLPQLNGVKVNRFAEFGNRIFLSTQGLGVVSILKDEIKDSINSSKGLSSNVCTAIAIDNDSTIWVTTNKGLNRISGYPDNVKIETFGTFDGLSTNVINDVLIRNDTVWLATDKGLNFFNKNDFLSKKSPPKMLIESMNVDGRPIKINKSENLFSYDQNDISISYVGLSPSSGGNILYRYKLSDNSPWKFTRNRSINFSALSPGDYTFTIAAKGKTGDWSSSNSLRFKILKPYWQTYIFILFVGLFAVIIIGFIVKRILNNQKLKGLQEQRVITSELRSLKAQISPHFIFNALNSIQGELLKKQPEIALSYLGKLGKLMREVLDQSDRLFVDISQEVSILTNYLEMEKFKTGHKFDYIINVSPDIDIHKLKVPSMIIQPFVENSIWHGFSEPGKSYELSVNFDYEQEDLIITIKDNGIGVEKAKQMTKKSHNSKGLNMVLERLDALNYKRERKMRFRIEEITGKGSSNGTIVEIIVPQ